MTTSPVKKIARVTVILSAVTLFIGAYALFTSIRDFNRANPAPVFLMRSVPNTSFEFAGHAALIDPQIDDATGEGIIRVTYADDSIDLTVAIPSALALPGLNRYSDWFQILRFVESEAGEPPGEVARAVEAGERRDRLVIVTRTPTPEKNDGLLGVELEEGDWGFGETIRRRWVFDFYELLPEGTIGRETLMFPTTKYYEQPIEGELNRGTWQFDAAFRVMPTGSAPKHNFTEAALVESEWRMGLTGVSILVLIVSLLISFAPERPSAVPGEPATDEQRAEAERRRNRRRTGGKLRS